LGFLACLLFGCFQLGHAQGCDIPRFNSAPTFNAGKNPGLIAAGDLNGDGASDLVVPNVLGDTFSVLFGDGAGGFGPPITSAVGIKDTTVGAYPRAAAIGDLNGDSKPDVVIAGGYANGWVSVLLGDGAGNFAPALNQATGQGSASGVVLGDFNGDGKRDVAIAKTDSYKVMLLLGNGSGGFTSMPTVTATSEPTGLAAGDFNNDGLTDIVAINTYFTWGLTIVMGRSDGNFVINQSITTHSQPQTVAVADFNRDGKLDLAMGFGWADYGVEIRLGDGSGSFSTLNASIATEYIPTSIAADDINHDNNPDFIVAVSQTNGVGVFLGLGNGSFTVPTKFFDSLPDGSNSLVVGDFNADGHKDVVAASYNAGAVAVMSGDGAGRFAAPNVVVGPNLRGPLVVVADFNSDGRPDVAIPQAYANYVLIYLTDGLGNLQSPSSWFIGRRAVSMAAADFNNDGKIDLVFGSDLSNAEVSVLLGNGLGGFTGPTNFFVNSGNPPLLVIVAGKFDSDNNIDLAVLIQTFSGGSKIAILRGDGTGGFSAPSYVTSNTPAYWMAGGDFNSDGKPDLAVVFYGNLSVLFGDGAGGFTAPSWSVAVNTYASNLIAADVNKDGRPDLIAGYRDQNWVMIFTNNGSGFDSPQSPLTLTTPYGLAVADFNGDTNPDLAVTTSTSNGNVVVMAGDGLGNVGAPYYFTANPGDIAVGDFNLDSKPDLVTSNFASVLTNTFTPLPCLSVGDVTVTEPDVGTINADFTISLSAPSAQTVRVNYSLTGVSATSGADFTPVLGRLTFAPGETIKIVSVPIPGDLLDEFDETFKLNLVGSAGAAVSDDEAIGTITDNDPTPSLRINDITVVEGGISYQWNFTVSLSAPSGRSVSVHYATANGTAIAGSSPGGDYNAASGTLTIAPGQASATVGVLVFGDDTYEPAENFFLNLTNPTNATIDDSQGQATIPNDDPLPTLTVDDAFASEGGLPATFIVRLSNPSYVPIVFNYNTSNDSATAGSDYVARSESLTINPGDNNASIPVSILDDPVDEVSERFFLDITNVQNANVGNARANGFIFDNDGPTISVNDVSVKEGNSGFTQIVFTLTLSATSVEAVTVRVSTAPGTATTLSDFNSFNANVTVPANTLTKTFTINVIGDTAIESDETFFVNLSNPINGTIGDGQGIGTILDDDTVRLVLETSASDPNQAAAFESLLFVRDPFHVLSIADWFNLGPDRNTRVTIFAVNLTLNAGETASAVTVNLVDANNQSRDIAAEDVKPVPNSSFTQVTFRLPDNLPAGTCVVAIKAHNQTTNTGRIRIAP
jgi:hypothetical protein